jgi:hypothetical protein
MLKMGCYAVSTGKIQQSKRSLLGPLVAEDEDTTIL